MLGRRSVRKVNITEELAIIAEDFIDRGQYMSLDEFVRESCRINIRLIFLSKLAMRGEIDAKALKRAFGEQNDNY